MKDYYKTLGVVPVATALEIKKAYRGLAFKYHPDKNPGNTFCEAHFKEVQEAYATLSETSKRAKYDEERWLMGVGSKTDYREAVTPTWLMGIALQLNKDLAGMDTYRMSHSALQSYILLILTDAHLGVLEQNGDREINCNIINELLKASSRLEERYRPEIINRLILLAGSDEKMIQCIRQTTQEWRRETLRKMAFPYIVMLITLALCLFMYFF